MDINDIPISIETTDPFDDPVLYGVARIRQMASDHGLRLPGYFKTFEAQAESGVEEQGNFRNLLRSFREQELEVLDSWVEERVIPVLVVSAPDIAGIALEVKASNKASRTGSFTLKLPGVELGADANVTIGGGFTLKAAAGETRQFGIRVPFLIDHVAVRGAPDTGNWHRATVASGERVSVVELISALPASWQQETFKLDASRDKPSGGLKLEQSYTLTKGASAALTIGFGKKATGGSVTFGVERENELSIELTANLPGGRLYTGAWLLGPAGARIDP